MDRGDHDSPLALVVATTLEERCAALHYRPIMVELDENRTVSPAMQRRGASVITIAPILPASNPYQLTLLQLNHALSANKHLYLHHIPSVRKEEVSTYILFVLEILFLLSSASFLP